MNFRECGYILVIFLVAHPSSPAAYAAPQGEGYYLSIPHPEAVLEFTHSLLLRQCVNLPTPSS